MSLPGPESPLEDHFRNPRGAGILEDADLDVRVENPVCGDLLHLYLRWGAGAGGAGAGGDEAGVEACRFQVYGCPAAIAAGSVLTGLVVGAGRQELEAIDGARIAAALGGLPSEKYHAAVLAHDAVRAVLAQWSERRSTSGPGHEAEPTE